MVPENQVYITGQGVVDGDALNSFVQTASTVATLRAFIGISGMQVYVQGTAAPNDGGQGSFFWNASGTGPDDNGQTTVVPFGALAGVWSRLGGQSITGINYILYNSGGAANYFPSATLVVAQVTVGGAGGGGGGAGVGTGTAGGGGGAGEIRKGFFTLAQLGVSVAITLGGPGNGGLAGSDGAVGGSTLFGGLITALGGQGGKGATGAGFATGLGGLGGGLLGSGNGGNSSVPGWIGRIGAVAPAEIISGLGADSPYGAGGTYTFAPGVGGTAIGNCAGGGGGAGSSAGSGAGGPGAPGIVEIIEYLGAS